MKYFSEVLKKNFDTEKACLDAEAAYKEKLEAEERRKQELAETRKQRAKEVEDAYKGILEAKETYRKLRNKFIEDYGSYHATFRTKDDFSIDDLFKLFF